MDYRDEPVTNGNHTAAESSYARQSAPGWECCCDEIPRRHYSSEHEDAAA